MHVMEIVSGTAVNGAVITCVEWIRALRSRGHQVTLVCRPDSWIEQQLNDPGVPIIRSDLSRWPLTELKRIARLARERDVDVLHTHMSRANFFGVLLRRFGNIPCVATANNRYVQPHWMFNDLVLAASDATRRFHCRYNLVSRRKVEVVYNFVDVDRLEVLKQQPLTRPLHVPANRLLVGVVADCIPRKGQLYLIRALPELRQSVPNIHLLLIGYRQKAYTRKLIDVARQLDVLSHITWCGARNDIAPLLNQLDIFCLPTLEDNLPLAILEAMAMGLPVVASRVGGIPECVEHGQTGYLIRPRRVHELVDAVGQLALDPQRRAAMGQAGHARVIQQFSRDSQTDRLEQNLLRISKAA